MCIRDRYQRRVHGENLIMEKTPKLRSIFDILEHFKNENFQFKWIQDIPIIPPKKKHLIDGNLMKKSRKGNLKLRWFVLLPSGLIKFRKHSQTVAVAFLPFKNPRVRKLENKEQRLVGFRLKSFGERYEFWMSAFDKLNDWMEKLGSICVLHNLSNCYSIGKQIGRCLLYTSPSPRDLSTSRMPSSA
eukprot:TRINITY_DN44682_c0_g1_i1.p1 TRINITY_DN44682_c0_g1~~TRINITY_DN44682_c0_g1_i1.p1  ORF type:complete len:187 (-),score=40.71 TRINITY_DN44682_c0_g1_i1:122-682(-)